MSMTLLEKIVRAAMRATIHEAPSLAHADYSIPLHDVLADAIDERFGTTAERVELIQKAAERIALAVAKVLLSEPADTEMQLSAYDHMAGADPSYCMEQAGKAFALMAAARLAALGQGEGK